MKSREIAAPAPAPAVSDDPGKDSGDFVPGQLKLVDVPQQPSDFTEFSFRTEAVPSVTYYAWKLNRKGHCSQAKDGYKVEPIKNPLDIDVSEIESGTISLCVLAYDSAAKRWQPAQNPDIYTWEKIAFKRTIPSYYDQGSCLNGERRIFSETIIEFNGSTAKSHWIIDPGYWGCDEVPGVQAGIDEMTIKSSTPTEISGFFTSADGFGGWFKFEWLDKERTQFKGSMGKGDIGQNPQREWNSDQDPRISLEP